ncbi:ribonuclease H-like domain-containing protein [Tanacetum coccineum]
MVTRFRVGTNHPTQRLTLHVSPISHLPKSYVDAFNDPNWQNAMQDEYIALIINNIWSLVPRPMDAYFVRCMWLFRHKYLADGTLSRYKARLVANGSTRIEVLMLMRLLDRVYASTPGFRDSTHPDYSKLEDDGDPVSNPTLYRSLAGSLQYLTFTSLDISYAVQQVCLYMHDPWELYFSALKRILKYVRGSSCSKWQYTDRGVDVDETFGPVVKPGYYSNRFRDSTHPDYVCLLQRQRIDTAYLLLYVDDVILGRLIIFWVFPVIRDSSGMFLSQRKYVVEILERAHMGNCNPSRTHVDTESKLEDDGDPVSDPTFTEAEYRGVANAVAETCWLRNLLRELHTPLSSATLVYCDNVSDVYLSYNPVQHQRTKHIEIDILFVRDLVAAGQDLRCEVVAGVSEQELRVIDFMGLASIDDKRWALFDVAANDLDTFFA